MRTLMMCVVAPGLILVAGSALAQDDRLKLTASAGMSYDTDVTISEIDSAQGRKDAVANVEFGLGYTPVKGTAGDLSVGVSASQSVHGSLSQFDITTLGVTANATHKVGKVTLGVLYAGNDIFLGSNRFLTMQFLDPSALVGITPVIYARPHVTYIDERFAYVKDHDAKHVQPGVQVFYFFDRARSYALASVSVIHEKDRAEQFSYYGYTAGVTGNLRVDVLGRKLTVKPFVERTVKDYRAVDPSIGDVRYDRQTETALEVLMPVSKKWTWVAGVHHFARQSNFAPANLGETVTSLTAKFAL